MIHIQPTAFGVILALLFLLGARLAWKATHSESRFDFSQIFMDADGKTSMARVAQFSALVVSTWAFVYLTVGDKMTEWYFAGYMAAWVVNGLGSKWIDGKDAT